MSTQDLRFIRLPEVLSRRGIERSKHLRDVKAGRYPPAVKLGACAVWAEHEIHTLMRAELRGATDDELRALTIELVEQRASVVS